MSDPRTPAEALRWAAWETHGHGAWTESALARDGENPQSRRMANIFRSLGNDFLAEAARLEAAEPAGLSARDVWQIRDAFAIDEADYAKAMEDLAGYGLAIVRVPK